MPSKDYKTSKVLFTASILCVVWESDMIKNKKKTILIISGIIVAVCLISIFIIVVNGNLSSPRLLKNEDQVKQFISDSLKSDPYFGNIDLSVKKTGTNSSCDTYLAWGSIQQKDVFSGLFIWKQISVDVFVYNDHVSLGDITHD